MMYSDGCTMPKFIKKLMKAEQNKGCCVRHDYDRRNPKIGMNKADGDLFICVWHNGYKVRAILYWTFVVFARPYYIIRKWYYGNK